jgi:transketolase
LSSLRSIPGLQVIRPADPNETAHAWLTAVTHDGPTAIILSRQNVPSITDGTAVKLGAGIIKGVSSPVATIIGTGSEVGTALEASVLLEAEGISTNVVSLPSWDRFLSLSPAERNAIIPTSLPRISVEAGSTFGWAAIATHSVGIDRFGASAPGNVVMEKLGITAANVAATVKAAIAE